MIEIYVSCPVEANKIQGTVKNRAVSVVDSRNSEIWNHRLCMRIMLFSWNQNHLAVEIEIMYSKQEKEGFKFQHEAISWSVELFSSYSKNHRQNFFQVILELESELEFRFCSDLDL